MGEKISIIGAAIVDVLVQGASQAVFQTGSAPAKNICMSVGGDAVNEASVLSRLGVPVELQTLLGADMAGELLEHYCEKQGIELRACANGKIPTGINVVLVDEKGERSFLTNPEGSLRKLSLEHIQMPFAPETKILCFASIFVFPLLKDKEMAEIFRCAKKQGILVCADMTKCKNGERVEDIRETLACIDYLMPNYEEAAMVTGEQKLENIADKLLEAGVKNVIIKCGKQGCFIKNAEKSMQIPAISGVKCVDTTGAGDSFAAGFVYGLWKGYDLRTCAYYANACGAAAVQKLGAAEGIKNLEQIEDYVRTDRKR